MVDGANNVYSVISTLIFFPIPLFSLCSINSMASPSKSPSKKRNLRAFNEWVKNTLRVKRAKNKQDSVAGSQYTGSDDQPVDDQYGS